MNQFISIVFLLFVSSSIQAQNSYLIEYDKKTDEFSYFKTGMANAKKPKKPMNRLPKLVTGDVVTVTVKNYNPFLYYVDISESEVIEESSQSADGSGAMSMLNMITGGLNPISSFLGTISDVEGMFSNRSAEDPAMVVTNEDRFKEYTKYMEAIKSLIGSYNKNYNQYQEVKASLYDENLYDNWEGVLDSLKHCSKKYKNPSAQVKELFTKAKKCALMSGLKGHKIREKVRCDEETVNNFKKLVEDPNNDYALDNMSEWIVALRNAKFVTSKSFDIDNEDAERFTIDEGSVLTGMVYEVNFYDIGEINRATRNTQEPSNLNYISYYYMDRFWNEEGELVDQPCATCVPVIRAEGLYEGPAPRYFEDFYNDMEGRLPESASGKWLFYDRDGELSKMDFEPQVRSNTTTRRFDDDDYSWFDMEETITERRNVTAPVQGSVVMSWSTGIYGVSSFQGRNEYTAMYNETFDTITVGATSLSNFRMCFGSQMVFDFSGNKFLAPSFNLGAAIDLWDDRDIHFLAGLGLKFKSFPLLSITGGISFTRMNQLNDTYVVGESYEFSGLEELSRKSYGLGYYVGLNINF